MPSENLLMSHSSSHATLWPSRHRLALLAGAAGAALLVIEELARRPWHIQTSIAFVSTSAAGAPVVLSLVLGAAAAVGFAPADRALGRDAYLRVAGVSARMHAMASLMRAAVDTVISVASLVVIASITARTILPFDPLPVSYETWSFTNNAPILSELAMALWMVGAAWTVVSLVHLGTVIGLSRLVVGSLGPVLPVLALALPGEAGGVVGSLFSPDSRGDANSALGWWSWGGGPLIWGCVGNRGTCARPRRA